MRRLLGALLSLFYFVPTLSTAQGVEVTNTALIETSV